jgi:hypothetical protein
MNLPWGFAGHFFSFALDLLHHFHLEATCVLFMTLHIKELALDTFGFVLGRRFVFK